jgi:hypothetical protein
VPPGRERELEEGRVDHLSGGPAPEQSPLQQVLLAAATGVAEQGRAADRTLVLEQSFEHVDRGPE